MALFDNCVAAWKLEETSGTRVDATGGGNNLTDNNTVTQASGKIGSAAQFTAANTEYFSLADNAAMSVGDIDFTFGLWVYMDSKTGPMGFIWKGDLGAGNSTAYGSNYNVDLDRFRFAIGNGSNFADVFADNFGAPSVSTWYCIIGWHDATANTINIQVNDGTVNSLSTSIGSHDDTRPFYLGVLDINGPLLPLNGRLDAVHFWKKVLTSGERTEFYNSGNGIEYPGVVARLPRPNIIQQAVTRASIY